MTCVYTSLWSLQIGKKTHDALMNTSEFNVEEFSVETLQLTSKCAEL